MTDIDLRPPPALAAEPRLIFREGVAKVKRRNTTILVSPDDGRSLRISKPGEALIPLLAEGTQRTALEQRLAERYAGSHRIGRQLDRFLGQLREAGLLATPDASAAPPRRSETAVARIALVDMDPPARLGARVIRALPAAFAWALLVVAFGAALAALALLAYAGTFPHPSAFVTEFHVAGVLGFVLVVVPLHEYAHALACRLAGIEAGKAGIVIHGFTPGPYVETGGIYRLESRASRFWIPVSGPIVDLLAAGAGAGLVLAAPEADGALEHAGQTLMLLALLFIAFNTNPLMPSDGSRMIEALLDDELARASAMRWRAARLSARRDVALYRIYASIHLQGVTALFLLWWF